MDSKIGLGLKFDKIKSRDFYKHYIKYNKRILSMLEPKIKNNSLVADYGGGNGILARDLIELCRRKGKSITIENIDIDKSRFEKIHGVKNVAGDIRAYRRKGYYDSAIARHVMHYLSPSEQLRFLKNVRISLKPGGHFLLVNFVQDDEKSYAIVKEIFSIVAKWKRIVRKDVPTSEKMLRVCRKSKFMIMRTEKYDYGFSINDFYKNRYRLNKKQVAELRKKLGSGHKISQLAILMRR